MTWSPTGSCQERGHVLEVAGELGPVPGERHPTTTTPCCGQFNRRSPARTVTTWLPLSRCRHEEGARRVS
jgi:hypothetical protein